MFMKPKRYRIMMATPLLGSLIVVKISWIQSTKHLIERALCNFDMIGNLMNDKKTKLLDGDIDIYTHRYAN